MLPVVVPRPRRRFSREFKQQLVDQCQPGVSVSGIVLANGVNANLLRRWIHERTPSIAPTLIASPTPVVPIAVQAQSANSMIEITIHRKGHSVSMSWPVSAADSICLTCCQNTTELPILHYHNHSRALGTSVLGNNIGQTHHV